MTLGTIKAVFWAAFAAATVVAPTLVTQAHAVVPEYTVAVVKTYPHDAKAFTEGLFYKDGFLYESTGRKGQSWIRKEVLETGVVLQQHTLDPQYFGEGIVSWQNKLIGLTWQSGIGFVYDLGSFNQIADFHYTGEGWALTQDGAHLIMSDGTADLRILDPASLHEISRLHVTCDGREVRNINELEWIKGEIYANIWLSNVIVRINPANGYVTSFVDLTDLADSVHVDSADGVLNGIAYDAAGDRLFVTGKLWPSLFQVALVPKPNGWDLCAALR